MKVSLDIVIPVKNSLNAIITKITEIQPQVRMEGIIVIFLNKFLSNLIEFCCRPV